MSNYIIFDLEWNQGSALTENPNIPFEIIEIGAVKLDANKNIIDRFNEYVRPQVYKKMNFMTRQVIHMDLEELKEAEIFPHVVRRFLRWCGEDYIFCTWGNLDLTELQINMRYYGIDPLSDGPIKFLDVQKLFSLVYSDGKSRRALETAVDFMKIEKNDMFHRADSDAYYTAEILRKMNRPDVEGYYSIDVFHTPKDAKSEVHARFKTYSKYISREFESKQDAQKEPEVAVLRCYICGKALKKSVPWFTVNNKHYYSVGNCDEHGLMRAKLRLKKNEDGNLYVVKTVRNAVKEDIENLKKREKKSKAQAAKLAAMEQKTRGRSRRKSKRK